MISNKNKVFVFGALFLILISCAVVPSDAKNRLYEVRVNAVVDGDTIKIQFLDKNTPAGCSREERVRLIGVNTPELTTTPPEYYANEARLYTNQFYRKTVFLEFDTGSALRDRYGRLLAYVYSDIGTLSINEQLIAGGYGIYYGIFAFNQDRMNEFNSAEKYAQKNRYGIWR